MTEETGVQETVAESQEQSQVSDQDKNWEEARKTMAEQKQQLEMLQRQNELMQQQQAIYQANSVQQVKDTPDQQSLPWEAVSDDDVLTGADFKKAMQQGWSQLETNFQKQQQELQKIAMKSQYPDYESVVGYALKEAETNPALAQAMASSSDPYTLAYEFGKRSQGYMSYQQSQKQSKEAEKILENAQKPGSVNQASTGSSALSKAEAFMNMSNEDFERHIAKVKRGFSN